MRVVGGAKRGFKLRDFGGSAIRPTSDRVKENIFNIISPYVPGAVVLDLFSGTGALAIEALSRGAKRAVLCDNANRSLAIIRDNIKKTGFGDVSKIVKSDAIAYLKNCIEKYDIIFLDPPFNMGLLAAALRQIAASDVLTDSGIVVVEQDGTEILEEIPGLSLKKQKKYGRIYISVYTKIAN